MNGNMQKMNDLHNIYIDFSSDKYKHYININSPTKMHNNATYLCAE